MNRLAAILMLVCCGAFAATLDSTNTINASGYVAGDTVRVWGTITNAQTITNSGTVGNPITFQFQSGTRFTAPTLPNDTAWITVNSNYITIDGGVNGIIECTDNGTIAAYTNYAGVGTKANQNATIYGIKGADVVGLTVKNLTISNLYNRLISSNDPQQGGGNSSAINITGSDITIQNNTIFNSQDGVGYSFGYPASSNIVITGNTFTGWNHAITIATASPSNAFLSSVTIRSNRMDGMDYYESTDGIDHGFHRNGIFIFVEATGPTNTPQTYYAGCISNVTISCNHIGPGINPKTTSAGTGAIFLDHYSTNQMKSFKIYNNVLSLKQPLSWANGWIVAWMLSDSLIANNTCVGWSSGGSYGGGVMTYGGPGTKFYNNLMTPSGGVTLEAEPSTGCVNTWAANSNAFSTVVADYNIIPAPVGNSFSWHVVTCWTPTSASYYQDIVNTLAQWQSYMNFQTPPLDTHSTSGTPALDANYVPTGADTVARDNGVDLSAYFTTDANGNTRSAPWDIGAYEYRPTNAKVTIPGKLTVVGKVTL